MWLTCLATLAVIVLLTITLHKLRKSNKSDRVYTRFANLSTQSCTIGDPPCVDEPGSCDEPGGCKCCKLSSSFVDANGKAIQVPMQIYGPVPGADCVCIAPGHPDCDVGCYTGCQNDDNTIDQDCLDGCQKACGTSQN